MAVSTLLISTIVLSLVLAGFASANCDYRLEFGTFAPDAPFLIAQQNGFFDAQSLCVHLNFVTGSVQQFNSLLGGQYDVISTAADNVANRIINLNLSVSIVGGQELGVGLDLVVNPNYVTSWSQMATANIAVDSPTSGFVLALQWMARARNVTLPAANLLPKGGGTTRLAALVDGSAVAAMFNNPFTDFLPSPLVIFDKFHNYVTPYQNLVFAVSSEWLSLHCHREAITRFLLAYSQAQAFVLNQANQAAVVAVLQTTGLTEAQAISSYAEIIDPLSPFNSDCRASIPGLQSAVNVRQSLGLFVQPVDLVSFTRPTPLGFYDERFCRDALDRLHNDDDHHH